MPPRRSSRNVKAPVQQAPAAAQTAADDDEEALQASSSRQTGKRVTFKDEESDYEGEDEEFEEPAAKKAKTASKKGKGKAAPRARKPKKLELFQSVPLDVLLLIMKQLDSKTLLAMNRTCSTFRTLLRSGQGASAWKAARANTANIPDLTASDVPEWELAALLFDSNCHVCHKSRAPTLDYILRARGCAACMRSNSQRIDKMSHPDQFHRRVWECVPESQWMSYMYFWLPTVRAVSKRLKALDGKAGFDDYIAERNRIKAAAKIDGAALSRWEARWKAAKEDASIDAAEARANKIMAKLKDLGYNDNEITSIRFHNLVNQPRDLTDRIWNSIKPQLVQTLEDARETKRKLAVAQAMKQRADNLRPFYDALHASVVSEAARSLFPPFGNFLLFSAIKPLYEPEDAAPTTEDLNRARAAALQEADEFAQTIQRSFLTCIVRAHMAHRQAQNSTQTTGERYAAAPLVSAADAMSLAKDVTSAVKCPKPYCPTYATFPAILDHFKTCSTGALAEDDLRTSPDQVAAIGHVIAAIGNTTLSSSTSSLYALGRAFKCTVCSAQPALGAAYWATVHDPSMTWSTMVYHLLQKHTSQPGKSPMFPKLEFTPPAPPSPGEANPGGFLADSSP